MPKPCATTNLIPSLFAAAIAYVIVLAEGHVEIHLDQPYTWSSPLDHKCGLVLIGCCTWFLVEVVMSLFFPSKPKEQTYTRFRRGFGAFSGRMLQ